MHPAPSVILFSTLSGLGFGLLAWLGLGIPDVTGTTAFVFYFVGYALAVGGLFASVFHLGNKKNAIKAFSQWRSSWLSREGVAAIIALLAVAPYAIGRIFLDTIWPVLGIAGSVLSLFTVFCTAMIYTQLKTVPRWNTPLTPVVFLSYSVVGGALLAGQVTFAAWGLLVVAIVQLGVWMIGDGQFSQAGSSIETATGLGRIGSARLLESPHSGGNYLLKEMAYQIGRRHALKLRVIAILAAAILPALILLVLPFSHMLALVAVLSHLIGVFASRWLFFAEAKHVVSLYYDR